MTDPLDALVRDAMLGDAPMEQLQVLLREAPLGLAMNGDGRPLVVRSFDDRPCLIVTTSAPHRESTFAPQWRNVELAELVELLPDGIDVLINPGGPAPVRLAGDFIWQTVADAA